MNAAALREDVLARRKALSSEDVRSGSAQAIAHFVEAVPARRWQGLRVALYRASLPGELKLEELERHLAAAGARLFFPRVAQGSLEFVEVGAQEAATGLAAAQAWRQGPYGVWEPHPELAANDPRELDVFFVPGVAFGAQGERIGMGAGYYDRFLARIEKPVRIALAFDFQLFERLEQNPWDQPVDWIIAGTREIRNARARGWLGLEHE